MLVCPVCETKAKKENQEYCLNCAWELEYYFSELSEEEQKRYEDKLKIAQKSYAKSNTISLNKRTFIESFFNLIKLILILIGILVGSVIITKIILGESKSIETSVNKEVNSSTKLDTTSREYNRTR